MAEEPYRPRALRLEFQGRYDRYGREKLAQAYRLLVPPDAEPFDPTAPPRNYEEAGRDLFPSVLGAAEGPEDHC
jgi:hypothetical protein